MKKRLLISAAVAVLIAVSALFVHAEEPVIITTDDLERKYPSDDGAANRAQRQNERARLEYECPALKESMNAARKAAYDESDPRPYAERAGLYSRLKSEYTGKCGSDAINPYVRY